MRKNKHTKIFYAMMGILLLEGCISRDKFVGHNFYHKNHGYKIKVLSDGWDRKKMEGVDLVYWNPKLNSTIAILSHCGKSRKASLKQLTKNLLIRMEEWKILSEKSIMLRGQKGRETLFFIPFGEKGSMLKVVVTKKGSCVYDLIYFGPLESFEKGLPDFQKMVESFEIT